MRLFPLDRTGALKRALLILCGLLCLIILSLSGADTSLSSYNDGINQDLDAPSDYYWFPDHPGNLSRVQISGYLEGESANVSLDGRLIYSFPSGVNPVAETLREGSGDILLDFSYGLNPAYDPNNDGLTSEQGVVDFAVTATEGFDDANLCTHYTVEREDTSGESPTCFGNPACCAFLDLSSESESWDDPFLLNYGKYGAGANNTVGAQIVYYHATEQNGQPLVDIRYSGYKILPAQFHDKVYFTNACAETCSMFLAEEPYYQISLDGEGSVHISNISYEHVPSLPPVSSQNIGGCSSGTVNTVCVISGTKYYHAGEVFNGTGTLIIANGGSIQNITHNQTNLVINFSAIVIQDGGRIMGGNITLLAQNVSISRRGVINGTGYGYLNGTGPGVSPTSVGPGGSHGGLGGHSTAGGRAGGPVYDSALQPFMFGSGGRTWTSGTSTPGNGGGIIRIESTLLSTNGTLVVDGGAASGNYAGGGAGGSIYIMTSVLEGNSSLFARGGAGIGAAYGTGGGGGRIAVYYNQSRFDGFINWSVDGGIGPLFIPTDQGLRGTMILADWDDASAILNQGFRFEGLEGLTNESFNTTFYNTNRPGYWNFTNLTIHNSTLLYANVSGFLLNVTTAFNSITAAQGEVDLRSVHLYSPYSLAIHIPPTALVLFNSTIKTTNETYSKQLFTGLSPVNLTLAESSQLQAANISLLLDALFVDSTSWINASYLGLAPNFTTQGSGMLSGAGGSHIGLAGTGGQGGIPGQVYDSCLAPVAFGASGLFHSGYFDAGTGGGVIKISARIFTLNGTVKADGSSAAQYGGGGAGGSIYVVSNSFDGNGTFTATGGAGVTANYGSGAGGGAIAVYYNTTSFTGIKNTLVTGGSALGSSLPGGVGSAIFADLDDTSVTLIRGFRFEGTQGWINESINTTFYNTNQPWYWNFTNLTILNATTTYVNISGFVLNVTNTLNGMGSATDIDMRGFNLYSPYSLDVYIPPTRIRLYNSTWKVINRQTALIDKYSFRSLELREWSQLGGGNITLFLDNITIDNSSLINASFLGFNYHNGLGRPTTNGSGAGAAYGGNGGKTGSGTGYLVGGYPYGSALTPEMYGSGGGCYNAQCVTYYGGTGAGLVRINTTYFSIDGEIIAHGQSSPSYSGGGSGGSIYITTLVLSGNGSFKAQGGNGATVNQGGGGSGGRIAVHYATSLFTGADNSSVTGGQGGGGTAGPGEPGTIIFIDRDDNTVIIKDGFNFDGIIGPTNETINTTFYNTNRPNYWNFTNLTIYNRTLIYANVSGFTLNVTNALNSQLATAPVAEFRTVSLYSPYPLNIFLPQTHIRLYNSTWKAYNRTQPLFTSYNFTSLGLFEISQLQAGNITLTLENLTIDATSSLNASNLGYAPSTGPGAPLTTNGQGASYGNKGGKGGSGVSFATPNDPYGDAFAPTLFGSGGGCYSSCGNPGGPGGGLIFINTTYLFHNGTLISLGAPGYNQYSGGGSGGSIYIRAISFNGNGTISARGGNSGTALNYGSGGSGGRIAIYYNESTFTGWDNISTTGGTYVLPGTSLTGESGTLRILDQLVPVVSYSAPTPTNGSGTSGSFILNATIEESYLIGLNYTWNGTKTIVYDPSLYLLMNFENNTLLGENTSKVLDSSLFGHHGILNREYGFVEHFTLLHNLTPNQMIGYVSDGYYYATINTTTDPYFFSNITNFDEGYNQMEIRLKNILNGPTSLKLYYLDNADCSAYSETCSQILSLPSDDTWHTLEFNISDAEWIDNDGMIDALKIDFEGASAAIGPILLDYIKFYNSTGPGPSFGQGINGNAAVFDGIDDYIEILDPTSNSTMANQDYWYESDSDMTAEFWINRNANSAPFVIGRYNLTKATPWSLAVHSDSITSYFDDNSFDGYNATNYFNVSTGAVLDGAWHHVAVTKDNAVCRIYLDGNRLATKMDCPTALDTTRNMSIMIGKYRSGTTDLFFNGSIDTLKIWNRTLTDAEVNFSRSSYLYQHNTTAWKLSINQTSLAVGGIYQYNITAVDRSNEITSAQTRTISGNTVPTFVSITHAPTRMDDLDPNITITVLANISDLEQNFASATLEWKNSSQSWASATSAPMNTVSSSGVFTFLNATFTPGYSAQSLYMYRIIAQDSLGETATSQEYNLSVFWDCTFNVSPESLGQYAGWLQNRYIANLTIINTGDVQYQTNNCTIDFRATYNLDEGRICVNDNCLKPSDTFSVPARQNASLSINASFLGEVAEETAIITIRDVSVGGIGISSTDRLNASAMLISNQNGPYHTVEILTQPTTMYLTPSNLTLTGRIRNLMGDGSSGNSSFNVSAYWEAPSTLTNISGKLNTSYVNLSDNTYRTLNVTISFVDVALATPGTYIMPFKISGYSANGTLVADASNNTVLNDTIALAFVCYNESDLICVTGCGNPADPDCPVTTLTETVGGTTSGGGGGGGGGGAPSGGRKLTSSAIIEVVRGGDDIFNLPINNTGSSPLGNLTLAVSGFNARYIEIVSIPGTIPSNHSANATIRITSPTYFTSGTWDLVFLIQGVYSDTMDNNTVTKQYREEKLVTLEIHEISNKQIVASIMEANVTLNLLESRGISVTKLYQLVDKAVGLIEDREYEDAQAIYEQIILQASKAEQTAAGITSLQQQIADAGARGISAPDTTRLLTLASAALQREDYDSAFSRIKEAELTFVIETKAEFSPLFWVKNNPLQFIGYLVGALLLATLAILGFQYVRINEELRMLYREKDILIGLMKAVQHNCFEENKMSMEEYSDAMQEYEKRLSNNISRVVALETAKRNFLKSGVQKMQIEREHLLDQIKQTQKDYLEKGTVETMVYQSRMESYSSRLSDVEEALVLREAQAAISKENTLLKGWKRLRQQLKDSSAERATKKTQRQAAKARALKAKQTPDTPPKKDKANSRPKKQTRTPSRKRKR